MSYASETDLKALFGADEIETRAAVLPAGAVARALADADAEIDSYLSGRVQLPLGSAPAILVRAAAVMARHQLLGEAVTERARRDYEDVRGWLKDIHAGRAALPNALPLPGAGQDATVEVVGRERVFTGGVL